MNEFEIGLLCLLGAVCVGGMLWAYLRGAFDEKE